ncbi:MAG: 3'-5' exonuclease [Bradymonadales bacterium]|jgi:DNA polymerase III epsilon subunit family exonuclease
MDLPELWYDLPLAVFDVETTGFSPDENQIIEIGVVHFHRGELQESFNWLIDPECEIPPEIVKLTGITQEDVTGKPTFREIAADFVEVMKGRGLVAYNLAFDRSFLSVNLERCGYQWFDDQPSFDPLIFARHISPQARDNKLVTVAKRYNISLEGAHRACNDAEATGKVLYAMRDALPPVLQDLIVVQVQWEIQQRNAFRGKDKRRNSEFSSILSQESAGEARLGPAFIHGSEADPLRAYYDSLMSMKEP